MRLNHDLNFQVLLLLCLLVPSVLRAQSSTPAPLKAEVLMGKSDKMRTVMVHDIRKGSISLALEGADRAGRIPIGNIRKIRFALGARAMEGQKAAKEERYSDAINLLQPYVTRLMPFLSIPENNIASLTDPYVLSIQQVGRVDRLRAYYKLVAKHGDKAQQSTASAWLAYLDVREGELEAAEQAFEDLEPFELGEEGYLLRHIGTCHILLARQETREAVDYAAKVTAACGIDHVLHPEALFLSAQCYDALAAEELLKLGVAREAKMKRALLIERVKVAREMEAKADTEGLPEPTEEQILQGVDETKVDKQLPPLPGLDELKLSKTAQRLYLFLERVFPDTKWGKQATEKVLTATRQGRGQSLSMTAPPPEPIPAKTDTLQAKAPQEAPPEPIAAKTNTLQTKAPQAASRVPSPTKEPSVVSAGRTVEQYLADWKKALGGSWGAESAQTALSAFIAMDTNKDDLLTKEEEQAHAAKKKK